MFSRFAASASRTSARFSKSFSAQAAGARSSTGNQFRFASAVAATAAIGGGAYFWDQRNKQYVVCEPEPTPAPAPVPAPAPAAVADAGEPRVKNCAFVFVKPHAVTASTKAAVADGLRAKGIKIVSEGPITAEQIDEGMLIDQHYYAIASKATILKPNQLNVPADKFQKQFGLGWQEALNKGVVYNAKDACDKMGVSADELNKAWGACKKAKKLIKFGGGFYCGLIDTIPGQDPIYVFNGFFMTMRSAFVKPGSSIYYYSVEWDASKLSWADFRGQVLGPTDPEEAPKDSLRGLILSDWQRLGLAYKPNVGDNGVHASASPFEGLAERMNWLGASVSEDHFGKNMLDSGISASTIKDWSVDPQVTYGGEAMSIKGSLFDALEDTDADECLARCIMIDAKKPDNGLLKYGIGFAAGTVAALLALGGSK